YPTIPLQEESFESPTGEFLLGLARGEDPTLRVHRGYQVGVRIVLPPYPFDDPKTYDENSRNAAVVFEREADPDTASRGGRGGTSGDGDDTSGGLPEGVHIEDAKLVGGQCRVAGGSGMPLVVTGTGETMQAARERAYGRIDDVVIPNLYYRDDIGERWIEGDGDRLLAWVPRDVSRTLGRPDLSRSVWDHVRHGRPAATGPHRPTRPTAIRPEIRQKKPKAGGPDPPSYKHIRRFRA
ncbi:MAG: hypothetical protein V5A85_14520, partial [Haloarculaceae archaeon]